MDRTFTCKELVFLHTQALESWVWVFGIGVALALVILIVGYIRLRSDNAALHHLIRSRGGP